MILALGLSATILNARTWTDTKSGNTAEGEFVSLSSGQVQIKLKSGRVISILLSRLSETDQEYIKSNHSKPTNNLSNKQGGSLAQLTAPISIKSLPLTGEGDKRKAGWELKNNSKRDIKEVGLNAFYLKADGTVGKTFPHTEKYFYGLPDNIWRRGETYKYEINHNFMPDDTASVEHDNQDHF